MPEPQASEIHDVARDVTYGWGMIPALVRIGATEWETALWPRHGRYVVPLKAWVRKAECIDTGDTVEVRLTI